MTAFERLSNRLRRLTTFVDDTEAAIFTVKPTDNVYSYFMFITPTELRKEGGGFTWDTIMAYLLIVVNFTMQGVLLYAIFNKIVVGNIEWQNGIMKVGGADWGLFDSAATGHGCNDGGSLCFIDHNKSFSCAPPSVQLTGRWEELDTDGDGIWTQQEVMEAREKLQCKYVVDPVEVFNVFISFLKERENVIWLSPQVKQGKAIPKPYFTYASGDIIMCGYRSKEMCPNLLKRGVFHAPLKHKTAPRVGVTIESALDYCYDLLAPGGHCERILPSTYAVWRQESEEQCKEPEFSKIIYENPGNGVIKSLLEVDYEARVAYSRSKTGTFKLYKCIIIALWCLTMLVELREIVMDLTWAIRFPDAAQFGENAVKIHEDTEGNAKFTIQGITMGHRCFVGLLCVARLVMTGILLFVGVSYLLKQTSYIDLIMDAVALGFIIEISRILYAHVLHQGVREQCEALDPMTVPMFGNEWLNQRPTLVNFIEVFAVAAVVAFIMYTWYSGTVEPLYEALECACLGKGAHCHEADRFSYDFWYKYWQEDVPNVFKAVAEMRSQHEGQHANLVQAGSSRQRLLQQWMHRPSSMAFQHSLGPVP